MNKKRFNLKRILAASLGVLTVGAFASSNITSTKFEASASGDINYAEALELSLYFYDANQCGCEVDDNCLTWRGNCHTYDAEASLDSAVNLDSAAKEFVKKANGGSNTVDVSGGYHDAGDHVKFSLTMGFNATSLGWAYYDHPQSFKDTGTEAHLFYILRETCDYFMKTIYLDENDDVVTFCYNVSDDSDHSYWTSPEEQTYPRKTYWATSSKNNSTVCYEVSSALASTAVALKDSDPEYSKECLKYAEAMYEFGTKYSGNETAGMGSMYGTENAVDEKAWAGLWLYIADNSRFSMPTDKPTQNGCYNGNEYDCWVYCWNKVWGGYASLMYKLTKDQTFGNEVKYEMNNLVNNMSQAYYPISGWGTSRYNCAWQKYAITYSEVSGDKTYLDYAKKQMDYILGNNPTGYSFLIGYSDKYPVRIHHRAANPGTGDPAANTESKYTLYGALIGGPTDANGAYVDHANQYQYTEPALDYNACFTLAIAGLYANYGGNTSAAKEVIKNAAEINENFDFGGGKVVPPIDNSASFEVYDEKTGELVSGAELYLEKTDLNLNTTETVGTWNTSEENPKTFDKLLTSIEEASTTYTFGFNSLPDGYSISDEVASNKDFWSFAFYLDTDINKLSIRIPLVKKQTTESSTETIPSESTNSSETLPSDEIDWSRVKYGDTNLSGEVDLQDLVTLAKYFADPTAYGLSATAYECADVDHNGSVGSSDSVLMLKVIGGQLTEDALQKK